MQEWENADFELVICDLLMPDASGLTFLSRIADRAPHTASIVMTAINEPQVADQALDLGVYGYVVKPVDPPGLIIAVRSALKRREAELQSSRLNLEMTNLVHRRTEALMGTIESMRAHARTLTLEHEESIHALSTAAEFRGLRRTAHTYRIGRFAALLARAYGLSRESVTLLRLASALHDIGNVGIPKEILTKRDTLEPDEMKIIQKHVRIGSRILSGYDSELMKTAAMVALTHHERWDGTGYPDRLSGEEIPIAGRIVAIADVFDALVSERVHRDALEVDDAFAFIEHGSGSLFDPQLVKLFGEQRPEVERLLRKYTDRDRVRAQNEAGLSGDL
jgi:putative two-component system response regulator